MVNEKEFSFLHGKVEDINLKQKTIPKSTSPSMPGHNNVKIANGILGRANTGHDEVAVTNDMKLLHNTMKYKQPKNETENKKIENDIIGQKPLIPETMH